MRLKEYLLCGWPCSRKGGKGMSDVMWAAVLSLLGTLIGTFTGIVTSAKLTEYRLNQLEKKVGEINQLVVRIYQLEKRTAVHEERLRAGTGIRNRNFYGPT